GIGCVLVLWGILACVGAGIVGAILAATRFAAGAGTRRQKIFPALGWFAAPFLYVAYFAAAFVVYWVVSEARGYDQGIGDRWTVPLGHGYEFRCIDTYDQCFVQKDRAI